MLHSNNSKRLSQFFNKFKFDIFSVSVLIIAISFAWHGVMNQTIEGEGYFYFSPTHSFILPNGNVTNLAKGIDNFPKLSYFILENIFGGEMKPYMISLFLGILIVHISFYIFIKKITNNYLIAFLASLYFALNYSGNFQFYARGHFQWFTQRVPELVPVFISFYYYVQFLKSPKIKLFLIALSFFVLAILFNHYTTLSLPFIPAIALSSALLLAKKNNPRVLILLSCLPFIVINYLFFKNASLSLDVIHPNQSFLGSFLQTEDVVPKVSFQLVVITIPYPILDLIRSIMKQSLQTIIFNLMILVYGIYFLILIFLYKRRSDLLYFILGSFIALILTLFLNIYLNRVKVYNEIEQGRYYYIPGIYVGIILATFLIETLKSIKFTKSKPIFILIILLICSYWIISNTQLVWKKIHDSQYVFTGGKLLLDKLSQEKNNYPKDAIVMLPNPLMPLGEDFLKKYYSGENTKFVFIDSKWQSKIPENFDKNKLFVFDYNEEYKKGGRADISRIEVLDKSEKFRKDIISR